MFGIPKRLIGLAVALLVAAATPAQAQTTLRYKFKEGEKLDYVFETTTTLETGGKQLVDSKQLMDMSWMIKSVDKDGKAQVQAHMSRVRVAMDAPLVGKIEYDSKKGEKAEGLLAIFQVLAGVEMSFTIDSRGEVSDLKIPDKVLKALKAQKVGGVGQALNADTLKQMVSLLPLPKEALAKGKSWNDKVSLRTPLGQMKVDSQYAYEGQADREGRTLEKILVQTKVEAKADPNLPFAIKSGTGKGTIYFDNASGRLVEMTSPLNMTVEALGQTMEVAQNTTLRLSLPKAKR